MAGQRLGLVICEDIWQDGGPVAAMAGMGLDALLVLNGSPYEHGKGEVRRRLARDRAAQLGCPLLYVNLVGAQDDLVFDGHSFVVDAAGELVAAARGFVEDRLVVELPGAGAPPRTPGGYALPARQGDTEQMYRAVVLGLRDYVVKNGFRSVVLGLSGGIDSALVAAVAADAVGAENVIGVSMPSRYSSEGSRDDAADLAARIGLDYRVQPIAPMVDAFEGELHLSGIAAENLQARMRGVILMAISNAEGPLVLATGNKSELAVGYSTIYGDAVGGFAPIKDVLKTQVWKLARWRNEAGAGRGRDRAHPVVLDHQAALGRAAPGPAGLRLPARVRPARRRPRALRRAQPRAARSCWRRGSTRPRWSWCSPWSTAPSGSGASTPWARKVTALAFGRDRRLPVTSRWREQLAAVATGPVDLATPDGVQPRPVDAP